jgi:hypothetical protein
MADTIRLNPGIPATPSLALERAALTVPLSVDVGDQNAAPPSILRGGKEVVPPVVVDKLVDNFVGGLVPLPRPQIPRVISQSVPANTRVAVGTTIDIVLVPVSDVNVGLLGGTHPDLANTPLTTLMTVVTDPTVQPLLEKTTDPSTLTADQKAAITAAFTKAAPNAPINENDQTRNFATVFNTLQSVRSFQ